MEAKAVRSLPWIKVSDWSDLPATYKNMRADDVVGEKDVDAFVENVFRDIERKLGIPCEQLRPILEVENTGFFALKNQFFKSGYEVYMPEGEKLGKLKSMLRVPDISGVQETVTNNNVSNCLKMFERLSNIEKKAFLQKLERLK